jgi:hypothetical protein
MKEKNHARYSKQTKDHDMKERNLSLSLSLSLSLFHEKNHPEAKRNLL